MQFHSSAQLQQKQYHKKHSNIMDIVFLAPFGVKRKELFNILTKNRLIKRNFVVYLLLFQVIFFHFTA